MPAWDRIHQIVAAEFTELGSVDDFTRIGVRLLVAALLGGLLGFEREWVHKAAGLRTHMLVSLGSCLFMLVAVQSGIGVPDLSRVIQGVVAGIGFLCAGAILKSAREEEVHGLTTSAGLWLTAAIGVCAGLGREGLAVISTLLALGILLLERPIKLLMRRRRQRRAGVAPQRMD